MNRSPLVAAVLAVVAVAARADESVLFEVQGKDKVLGTIRPASERESILCNLVTGTTLKASVKSTQKTGPVPTIELTLNDAPVAGAVVAVKGRGAALAPFVAAESGTYKVSVVGDAVLDGDYQFAVSWAAQKAFTGTGTSAGETLFPFSAPAGAGVTVTLAAAPGSAFVPHLMALEGPSASNVPLPGGGKAGPLALPVRGDWNVRFRSDAADGAYKVSVKVNAPKPPKRSIDIRDGALGGAFNGGSSVYGAVLEPDTGGDVGVTDPGSPIAGSSVSVPPGALGESTSIFVAESEPYVPPGGAHAAGPAVEFGPSGTEFDPAHPATVTIPYDPTQFPVDTSSLVVYVKSANGTVTAVPGPYVFGAGTVTFTTSHFSTFMAATTGNRAAPSGVYVAFGIGGYPQMGFGGLVSVTTGIVDLRNGTFDNYLNSAELHFGPPNVDNVSGYAYVTFGGDGTSGTTFVIADSAIELRDASGVPVGTIRRGRRDDALVVNQRPGLYQRTLALFRRPDGDPTLNSLAGRWHAFVWEHRAEPGAAGDTDRAYRCIANTGTATITGAGDVTFQFAGAVERSTRFPGGLWDTTKTGPSKVTGTIEIDPDSIPVLRLATGTDAPPIAFDPVLGGDALLASTADVDLGTGPSDAQVGLIILVRQSANASASDIAGQLYEHSGGLEVFEGETPDDDLGLSWRAQEASSRLRSDRSYTTNGALYLSGYAAGAFDPSATSAPYSESGPTAWSFSPDGRFGIGRLGVTGAAIPAGDVGFFLLRADSANLVGFAVRGSESGQ